MRFFIIKVSDLNSKWEIMLEEREDARLNLVERIESELVYEDSIKVNFNLIDVLVRRDETIFQDIHKWGHDLMLCTVPQPSAYILIISPILRQILQRFNIPQYYYHESIVNLGIPEDIRIKSSPIFLENVQHWKSEKAAPYNLLHILDRRTESLYYEECTFHVYDRIDKHNPVKSFKKGEILSNEVRKRYNIEALVNDQILFPEAYIYKSAYDIVWGYGGQILVNEKVKTAIEKANLHGIAFEEFTDYQIITGYQA